MVPRLTSSLALLEELRQKADEQTAGTIQDSACSTCRPPKDPCKGLRSQLQTHIQKLSDYLANPAAYDNPTLMGGPVQHIAALVQGMASDVPRHYPLTEIYQ